MLNFASAFDEYLVVHCAYLCNYTIEDIRKSVKREITAIRSKIQYTIKRSFSYINMTFNTLVFEIYKLQVKQNVLNRHENFYTREYFQYVNHDHNDVNLWFFDDHCEVLSCHFVFADISSQYFDKTEIEKWLKNNSLKFVTIHFLYSRLEITITIDNYEKYKKDKSHRLSLDLDSSVKIENRTNVNYMIDTLVNLRLNGMKGIKLWLRDTTHFDILYIEQKTFDAKYTYSDWFWDERDFCCTHSKSSKMLEEWKKIYNTRVSMHRNALEKK